MEQNEYKGSEEQLEYAKYMNIGMKIGLLLLVITFMIYVFGVLTPHVEKHELPDMWKMPLNDFLEQNKIERGWFWLTKIHRGDFLNFLGISLLAGITILCYIKIIPILKSKNDKIYTIIAVLEVIVLLLSASGLLRSGGH